jgi:epoxide hydrolase A/B
VGPRDADLRGVPPAIPALSPPPLPVERMYPAGHPDLAVRFVARHDGQRLRVVSAGPDGGRPVLLLHGWGASVYSYRWQIPALAGAGYRVFAADLPGHGLSDKPAALDAYTRPAMTAAVAELLDVLDVRDALVAGVSMGGGIATALAATHHPRVGRVALINPVGFASVRFTSVGQLLSPLVLRDYASLVVAKPLVNWFLRLAYADPARVTDDDVEQYWATAAQPGFGAALVACLHRFSWEPFPERDLAGIRGPVLLVLGTHDHLIVGSEVRASAIPRLEIVRIAGGHAVNEECPTDVNAALLAFARE